MTDPHPCVSVRFGATGRVQTFLLDAILDPPPVLGEGIVASTEQRRMSRNASVIHSASRRPVDTPWSGFVHTASR